MKQKKIILIFGIIFYLLSNNAFASPAKDEDFGIWNIDDVEAKINDKLKMKAGEELRFREHAGLVYYDTHVGVAFQAWKYLSVGGDYLQARQTRTLGKKDIWYWEERPRIYATPQLKYRGFLLEDRNLLEFRIKQNTEDSLRYRNMVTLTTPWNWTRFEIQPYIANEVFFESNRNGLVEDRFYNGVRYHLWRQVYGNLFYLRQFSKNSLAKWKDSNILGVGVKISL